MHILRKQSQSFSRLHFFWVHVKNTVLLNSLSSPYLPQILEQRPLCNRVELLLKSLEVIVL
jgi:hypothetical protein